MSKSVVAYNTLTGERHPHLVPESWLIHNLFPHLSASPQPEEAPVELGEIDVVEDNSPMPETAADSASTHKKLIGEANA